MPPKTRDFQDMLTDLDDGRVHEQLTKIWPEVVRAVRETNKPGSLTLTLHAKVERGTMVVVTPKVTTKLPAPGVNPTEDRVREIRASSESSTAMARRLGVSASTIGLIRSGKTWRHVA